MEWLSITNEENQDMHHEFIGNLIMKNGFKVRYNNIEEYSSVLQEKIKRVFAQNGYSTNMIYMQNYSYLEVTAIKQAPKYVDYAIAVVVLWAGYRVLALYLL
jgi:hypothetical protein